MTGAHFIVKHQRLMSLSYAFSATISPLLAASAKKSIDILDSEEGKGKVEALRVRKGSMAW